MSQIKFSYKDAHDHSEELKVQHKFEELFIGPHAELYSALCPFKAVFGLGCGKLVMVSTDFDGCNVKVSLHKNLVVV